MTHALFENHVGHKQILPATPVSAMDKVIRLYDAACKYGVFRHYKTGGSVIVKHSSGRCVAEVKLTSARIASLKAVQELLKEHLK